MQLTIPSELGQVRFLGLAVRAVLAELDCSEEDMASIELCLVEAVNNVIEHAYREEPGHAVEVSLAASAQAIELAVSDTGRSLPAEVLAMARAAAADDRGGDDAFDPDALAALEVPSELSIEVASLAEGGYGLRLIHQMMEDVSYERRGERNTLTMRKQLAAPPTLRKAMS
jgi:serine/threonine-protein kinase RsbW